jgi:hypothetical protein
MKFRIILAFLLIIFPISASATKYVPPPVTDETIKGVWEAVGVDNGAVTYFVMKIDTKSTSMLVQGTDFDVSFVSPLESMNIKDGKLNLTFRSRLKAVGSYYQKDGMRYQISGTERMEGTGVADSKNGRLEVELVLEPGAPAQRVWKLCFIKSDDFGFSLSERIRKNSSAAFEALKKGKGKFDK